MRDLAQLRPQPGWLVCRAHQAQTTSAGGILLGDPDKNVRTEGVAEIVAACDWFWGDAQKTVPVTHDLKVGDRILYRGFLRFAQQLGELYGAEKGSDIFLLNIDDVLATVEGTGSLGRFGEFR